jgi:thymidylate synthase
MHYTNPINGEIYEFVCESKSADDSTELINYKSLSTGIIWTRKKSEYLSETGASRFVLFPLKNTFDLQYLELTNKILTTGRVKTDRTGTGTISLTSYTFDIDISENFPLLTIKKTNYTSILDELLWFISGSTNTANLDTRIWDANSTAEFLKSRGLDYPVGYIGPSYGYQWRGKSHVPTDIDYGLPEQIDQLQYMVNEINNNSDSRRIIISNWDAKNVSKMALPPCHILFQVIVRDEYLDGIMYQRSADLFLGVPFNVASYSTLLYILANVTGKKPGRLVTHFGDVHIYSNHVEQAKLLNGLSIYNSPTLSIAGKLDLNKIDKKCFTLNNYCSGPWIKAPMAI